MNILFMKLFLLSAVYWYVSVIALAMFVIASIFINSWYTPIAIFWVVVSIVSVIARLFLGSFNVQ